MQKSLSSKSIINQLDLCAPTQDKTNQSCPATVRDDGTQQQQQPFHFPLSIPFHFISLPIPFNAMLSPNFIMERYLFVCWALSSSFIFVHWKIDVVLSRLKVSAINYKGATETGIDIPSVH